MPGPLAPAAVLFEVMPKGPWDRGSDAIGAALTLAVAVALFAWGGHRLDLALETSPLFLFFGAILGAVGGFLHLLRVLAPELRLFGRRPPRRSAPDGEASAGSADPQPTDDSDPPSR